MCHQIRIETRILEELVLRRLNDPGTSTHKATETSSNASPTTWPVLVWSSNRTSFGSDAQTLPCSNSFFQSAAFSLLPTNPSRLGLEQVCSILRRDPNFWPKTWAERCISTWTISFVLNLSWRKTILIWPEKFTFACTCFHRPPRCSDQAKFATFHPFATKWPIFLFLFSPSVNVYETFRSTSESSEEFLYWLSESNL